MAIHYGDVTLPDGRIVTGKISGYMEYDTNAYIVDEDRAQLEWKDGAELTADDCNEEFEVNGQKYYLGEYAIEKLIELPGEEPDYDD